MEDTAISMGVRKRGGWGSTLLVSHVLGFGMEKELLWRIFRGSVRA